MSHYDDVLRCERARLEPDEDEMVIEPCEFCGSKNYDYLLKNNDEEIVGCDDCVTRVYL
jgi:hypothetical protein